MARNGIANKIAIVGCEMTKYGEQWDKNQYDLLSEAVIGATKDAGIDKDEIDAAWLGVYFLHFL